MILNVQGIDVPCFLDWFLSIPGIISVLVSASLAIAGTLWSE